MGCFWNGKFYVKAGNGGGGGKRGEGNTWGLGLVSGTEILVKRLVMGATVKMVGAHNL